MSFCCFNWIAFVAVGLSAAMALAEPPHAESISEGEREQIEQAMRSIVIPELELENASLEEAVEFLGKVASEPGAGGWLDRRGGLEFRIRRHESAELKMPSTEPGAG